ncbi:hypothetical protein AB0I28_03595 [Phytomonospora sp. NPDC050363]|uniref:hypothetical protein n=1 Tax=Phytomonospora sp. NPDC050363 TaxID=3155642 RepID=UPI0033F9879F
MRRLKLRTGGMALRAVAVGALVCGLVGTTAPTASGDPSDPPAEPVKGEELCSISDQSLLELSGLVADGESFWAIPDGSLEQAQLDIYKIGADCQITETLTSFTKGTGVPSDARDPEDLAIDEKGRLWVADFGDNDMARETIALWRVDPENPQDSELYRMAYPDGPHDGETLLLQPDGTPVVVTKDAKTALVFKPAGKLEHEQTTDLEAVGQFTFEPTGTNGGPVGPPSQLVATGGAVSADGTKAVIRSYTDAYEWDVPDGDVAKAITGGTPPRRTPLPDEPQGEAITYGDDGKFVTGTEAAGDEGAVLYSYAPVVPAAPEKTADDAADEGGLFSDLTLDQVILLAGGSVGALGLILAGVGVFVIVKARKRRRLEGDGDAEKSESDGPDDDDDPRSRYAAAPGQAGYDRREDVYDPRERDRYDEGRGYDDRAPRDDPYGRREASYDRGYEPGGGRGYDDQAFRPDYRDEPPRDERYAPPPSRGGYRDEPRQQRYDGGPAPRPDRAGGSVYGGGSQRRDDYGREENHDPRPDFGIRGDEPRGY